MSSLANLPELVGFFSYSREDDEDSLGALSALRDRIQRELRGQLGRSMKTFRLWQDKEAIPSGTLWEVEIKNAVEQSAFFIPIITPTVVRSPYCRFELDSFLAREAVLGRNDLVFPILYIKVPELEDSTRQRNDPVLSIIAKRQYLDWREFRHRDVNSTDVKEALERFCANICNALHRSWLSPEERAAQEEAAALQHAEVKRKRAEAEAGRRAEEEEHLRRSKTRAEWRLSRPLLVAAGSVVGTAALGAIGIWLVAALATSVPIVQRSRPIESPVSTAPAQAAPALLVPTRAVSPAPPVAPASEQNGRTAYGRKILRFGAAPATAAPALIAPTPAVSPTPPEPPVAGRTASGRRILTFGQ